MNTYEEKKKPGMRYYCHDEKMGDTKMMRTTSLDM